MARPQLSKERERQWISTLNLMADAFFNGTFLFAEVQEYFSKNILKISEKYGGNRRDSIALSISKESIAGLKDDEFAPFICYIANNKPVIEASLPDLELMFSYINFEFGCPAEAKSVLKSSMVIGFLHELDHFAIGAVGKAMGSVAILIDCERRAWAKTCDETIFSLLKNYRQKLRAIDALFYLEWVKSGRNPESQSWKNFIADRYGGVFARSKKQSP